MTFSEAIRTCFSKFTTWQGRASRSEYWYFYLSFIIAIIIASVLDNILGTTFKAADPITGAETSSGIGYLYALTALGFFLPSLAAGVRRLHDTNRSGWWYWIALVPLIGGILLLVWFCTRGTNGSNDYGSDPLGGDLASTFG